MSCLRSNENKYLLEQPTIFVSSIGCDCRHVAGGMSDVPDKLFSHLFGRQDIIHQPGADGAPGHSIILGGFSILCHSHAAFALDCPQPHSALGSRTRKNYANRLIFKVLCKRTEKEINGGPETRDFRLFQKMEFPMHNSHVPVWRDNIDGVGFNRHTVFHFPNRHSGVATYQFR